MRDGGCCLVKRRAIEKQGDSPWRRSSAGISLYNKFDDDDVLVCDVVPVAAGTRDRSCRYLLLSFRFGLGRRSGFALCGWGQFADRWWLYKKEVYRYRVLQPRSFVCAQRLSKVDWWLSTQSSGGAMFDKSP